jgi:HAD superfamily hydrolase (TIGR01509 family)
MIRAIIFDFDGLILETEEPVYQSWQELYASYDCRLSFDDWATLIGTSASEFEPIPALEQQIGRVLPDHEAIEAQRYQRSLELVRTRSLQPGVQAYLEDARYLKLKIGLASSSSAKWVMGHLSRLGLIEYFSCIRTGDDVSQVKPDPELYLAVLADLNLSASETLALEDSPNGIAAAKSAGISCVAVPNTLTQHLSLDDADMQISSLVDVPLKELIHQIENHRGKS